MYEHRKQHGITDKGKNHSQAPFLAGPLGNRVARGPLANSVRMNFYTIFNRKDYCSDVWMVDSQNIRDVWMVDFIFPPCVHRCSMYSCVAAGPAFGWLGRLMCGFPSRCLHYGDHFVKKKEKCHCETHKVDISKFHSRMLRHSCTIPSSYLYKY